MQQFSINELANGIYQLTMNCDWVIRMCPVSESNPPGNDLYWVFWPTDENHSVVGGERTFIRSAPMTLVQAFAWAAERKRALDDSESADTCAPAE